MRATLVWGSVAECTVSVCCPLVMRGAVDVAGTTLNLVGSLVSGIAEAFDEVVADTDVHHSCVAFQNGFIGVFTSFSFIVDQAAELAEQSLWSSWLYISATIGAGYVLFTFGRAAFAAALRTRTFRPVLSWLRASQWHLSRWLPMGVCLAWLWVLVAPAGAVYDPLALHAARASAGLPLDQPPGAPSKRADVVHLAFGLGMQAVGLVVSERICSSCTSRTRTGIHWGSLVCNALACSLLILLRVGEAAALLPADTIFLTKLRTSFFGALSVCGRLTALFIDSGVQRERSGTRGAALQAALNYGLHLYLAGISAVVLWWLTSVSYVDPLLHT